MLFFDDGHDTEEDHEERYEWHGLQECMSNLVPQASNAVKCETGCSRRVNMADTATNHMDAATHVVLLNLPCTRRHYDRDSEPDESDFCKVHAQGAHEEHSGYYLNHQVDFLDIPHMSV